MGLIPGLGRSPGEGKGYPLQYSGLQNSMNCISSWGCKDSDTTERLSLSLHFLVPALAELIPIKIPLREVRKHHQLRLPFTNRLALMRAPHPLPMAVQRREEWGAGKAPHRGPPETWRDARVGPHAVRRHASVHFSVGHPVSFWVPPEADTEKGISGQVADL